ncbi:iron complex transport system substrate-binding protein [Halomicrobium zhouii]|uniref:Iron complex transport system substrate-binding protein n=1 Tax=Halomicrobium zhouii TaxID=767519 RepID=A0A1I6MAY1_9EURY|nr:ABC transporter substrate-binding protein [Halomicrobium zhouii]SFS12712.1 iron complex transport system substrate-binding protein [Halomicrobium zhouii]
MARDDATRTGPTRREWVRYGGAVVGSGLLAGCSGSGEDAKATTADEERATATGAAATDAATGTPETDEPYDACIEPVGCVTFESVPETYIVNNGEWADMAFALGQREGFQTATNMIPGFLFDPFGLDVPPEAETTALSASNWDKEVFYERDPDVVLIDPNYMHATGWDAGWDESDTEEIRENVAPFFGNNILRRREWHDYRLYSLYEAFERLADLFRERERYEAIAEIHDSLLETVQSRLPPADERPEIALVNSASDPREGTFYPMHTQVEGVETKPYRDLDVGSAFSTETVEGGTIDYETLVEIDPEIIVVHWEIRTTDDGDTFSAAAFRERYVEPMAADPVGSQLTAVENGDVYPGAFGSQGPLVNLLQTEMVAQQLYPDEFGEFEAERFPDVPAEKRLFDRQRVREVIAGDV